MQSWKRYHKKSLSLVTMEDRDRKKKKKKQKHQHPDKLVCDLTFTPSSDAKGLRFGVQFIVRSFTVRRSSPLKFLDLLALPASIHKTNRAFHSTTAFLPTNFTILAHHAWHTLTLGLGTTNSKVVAFVFESESLKSAVDQTWPSEIPLGEVNRKLIRGLIRCEMARFKFRKGCITFYIYAVRQVGSLGFAFADDLRTILQSVVALKDFVDHTAMLAVPTQLSISFSHPVDMAH